MIGNSRPEYAFIRICIAGLRLLASACIIYLAISALNGRFLVSNWLGGYAVAEAAFYLLIFLPRRKRLQAPPSHPPPPLTKAQRQAIFVKCLAAVHPNDPSYPMGWFLPTESTPKRDDVVDWLLWALFSTTREEAVSEMNGWKDELDEYVDQIEHIMDKKLEEGSDERVKSMRVTVDPVVMLHRPLLWYFIVAVVDSMTSLTLLLLGFKHYAPPQWFQSFPPRPVLSLLSRKAPPAALIPYWYKPHRLRTKLPLVFIHGIGIGLYPYIPTLRQLTSEDPDLGILLPELLPISMHMTPRPVPPRPAMLASLDAILESLCAEERASQGNARSPLLSQELSSWSRVVLAAHSYGTFVAGWVVRECVDGGIGMGDGAYIESVKDVFEATSSHSSGSDSILPTAAMQRSRSASSRTLSSSAPSNMPVTLAPSLSTKIAHLVLFDPIPILLSHPAVAHNFVYRHPSSALHHESAEASLGALANRESHDDYHAHEHPESSNPPTRSGGRASAAAWQLWYFASRDADVARTLGRAFFWSEGGIWREELGEFMSSRQDTQRAVGSRNGYGETRRTSGGRNVAVIIAGRDQIVPAEAVRRYLTEEEDAQERWSGTVQLQSKNGVNADRSDAVEDKRTGELEVVFFPEQDHATVFESPNRRREVVELLRRYVRTTQWPCAMSYCRR